MKNPDTDVRGGGVVLKIWTHPDKGRGWFENPRFWRTSFVDYNNCLIVIYYYTYLRMLTSALKKNSEGDTLPLSLEFSDPSTIKSKNKGRTHKKEKQRKG